MDIYCNNQKIIDQVKNGRVTASIIFHELQHSEQCVKRGGRKKYAMLWFNNLPKGFFGALNPAVKDKFKNKVHDAMPMEKEAENKAQSVARSDWWTRTAKCRVYKKDKKTIVYVSKGVYFRVFCDPTYERDGSKTLQKEAKKAASKFGYGTYYFAFGTPHLKKGVGLGKGKFGTDPKKIRGGINKVKNKSRSTH